MITRKIKIPLPNNREIAVIFYKEFENANWHTSISDEAMQDLINYFKNGYYQLDIKNPFHIEDIEEN